MGKYVIQQKPLLLLFDLESEFNVVIKVDDNIAELYNIFNNYNYIYSLELLSRMISNDIHATTSIINDVLYKECLNAPMGDFKIINDYHSIPKGADKWPSPSFYTEVRWPIAYLSITRSILVLPMSKTKEMKILLIGELQPST